LKEKKKETKKRWLEMIVKKILMTVGSVTIKFTTIAYFTTLYILQSNELNINSLFENFVVEVVSEPSIIAKRNMLANMFIWLVRWNLTFILSNNSGDFTMVAFAWVSCCLFNVVFTRLPHGAGRLTGNFLHENACSSSCKVPIIVVRA
jgi:hypothetical protein